MREARWHLLGAGSVGGLFGARLIGMGLPPVFILRDAATRALLIRTGLRVTFADGRDFHALPAACTCEEAGVPAAILVTTKAPDTIDALAPLVRGDGHGQIVLLLQNGMGVSEQVRARWPALRLWNGVTTAGVWRSAPFQLHCVAEGETRAGRWDDVGDAALDARVIALADAGILDIVDDIRPVLWRKLAVNAVINALTAIHACRNGELLEIPAARAQLPLLAAEVEAVAAAEGIRFDTPVLAMAESVIRATAENLSSMNRDVAAGRRTEIEYINGYVVACAGRHGIAVPANESVCRAVAGR